MYQEACQKSLYIMVYIVLQGLKIAFILRNSTEPGELWWYLLFINVSTYHMLFINVST